MSFVTCNLYGRCGNQMFQIATTIGYSIRYGIEFKIPINTVNNKAFPPYFKSKSSEIVFEKPPLTYKEVQFPYHYIPYYDGQMDGRDFLLDGYFQSEKYFLHARQYLLQFFRLPQHLVESGVVSIHVRRGDYLLYPDKHPVVTREYLKEAVNYFRVRGFNRFMVFSDDMPWSKDYLNDWVFSDCEFVYSENRDELLDMAFMSCCTHHIISNSSYSWWGAWMNRSEEKIVVAPKVWFGPGNSHLGDRDLVPSSWVRL